MFELIRSVGRARRGQAMTPAIGACVALTTIATPAGAQPMRPDAAPQPVAPGDQQIKPNTIPFRLRVEQVDFGVVRPHVESKTQLELFNASRFPVTLTRVTASCSCMGGIVDGDEVIQPGEVGLVDIAVKGRANPGPIRERVTVWYIDPESGRERSFGLQVVGEVADAVKPEPFFINLLMEEQRGSIDLTSTDGQRFRVLSFAGKAPVFDQSKLPEGETPGREATTRTAIRYDFTDTPEDQLPDFVALETDHPEAPLITLRVIHRGLLMRANDPTARPWSVSQDSFNLGRLAIGESVDRVVTVVAPRLADDFTATLGSDQIGVEVIEVSDASKGKEVRLRFTMRSGGTGVMRDSITIVNGPERMTLPVFALAAPGA